MNELTLKKIAKATAVIVFGITRTKPDRAQFNKLWQLIAAAIMQVISIKP